MAPVRVRSVSPYLILNLLQAVIALGSVAIYTHWLNTDAYGRYALSLTALQLTTFIGFGWLHSALGRFYAMSRHEERLETYAATTLNVLLAICGLLLLIWLGVGFWFPLEHSWQALVWAMGPALILRALFQARLEVHRAAERATRYALLEGSSLLLGLGMTMLLLETSDLNESAPLWGLALASISLLVFDLRNVDGFPRASGERVMMRRFFTFGWPVALSMTLSQILSTGDRFLVAWLLNDSAVGIYAVAYALVDRPMGILFNALAMGTQPQAFAAMAINQEREVLAILERLWINLWALALPAAVGLSFTAQHLAALFAAPNYSSAAAIIPWVVAGTLAQGFMVHYATHIFLLNQRTAPLLWTSVPTVLLNLLLNLFLIPPLGLVGAAISTWIAFFCGLSFRVLLARHLFTMPLPLPWRPLVRIGLAAAFMAVALVLLPAWPGLIGLFSMVFTGALTYGVAAWVLDVAECRSQGLAWKRGARS